MGRFAFLQTHKTGSQTLTAILNRYALAHNLSVAVRKKLYGHEARLRNGWIPDLRPLPPGVPHYDMITDHVRFDERCVRHFLPNDTVFVSLLREPLDQFVSSFYFYRDVWRRPKLLRIPGPDPVSTYLSNITHWDTNYGSLTNSQTPYDFGLEFQSLQDPDYLKTSITYLSRVFHLVLLTEAYDESLVLLKRTLSWKLQDMLYVKINVGKTRPPHSFTPHQRNEFEKHRKAEFALYRHFRSVFYDKVRAEDNTFPEEVRVFKAMRGKVESFCKEGIATSLKRQELRVEGTRFSERFRVSLEDCRLLLRESSSVKDIWFEKLMLNRLQDWSETWQWEEDRRSGYGVLFES
ncbi:galactose-3-O-sulfotransferase 2-like [Babylonia areolata]|uniref:galactose-3-O-sulfotransferase 2-like n=1 Tax=Babylonia areolata TaxID=304850 RepID=UPI003FD69DEA